MSSNRWESLLIMGDARVVVDETNCVVIERYRVGGLVERHTVTDVVRLVEALGNALSMRAVLEEQDRIGQ